MTPMYKPGDVAYIVANSIFVKEVMILKVAGGFVTFRFMGGGGAARLRENRLFSSREAAEAAVKESRQRRRGSTDKAIPMI